MSAVSKTKKNEYGIVESPSVMAIGFLLLPFVSRPVPRVSPSPTLETRETLESRIEFLHSVLASRLSCCRSFSAPARPPSPVAPCASPAPEKRASFFFYTVGISAINESNTVWGTRHGPGRGSGRVSHRMHCHWGEQYGIKFAYTRTFLHNHVS